MGHLSLVGGECLNASSSSGNIGSRAAHLPNGKKIVADVVVSEEGKDAVLSYGHSIGIQDSQGYDYAIQVRHECPFSF